MLRTQYCHTNCTSTDVWTSFHLARSLFEMLWPTVFRLGGEETSIEEEVADHHWLSSRKSQEYLIAVGGQEDCCPSQMEMIEPNGGSNPDGLYVELFR